MYVDDRKIGGAYLLTVLGEESFKELNNSYPQEQQEWLEGLAAKLLEEERKQAEKQETH